MTLSLPSYKYGINITFKLHQIHSVSLLAVFGKYNDNFFHWLENKMSLSKAVKIPRIKSPIAPINRQVISLSLENKANISIHGSLDIQ